LEKNSYTFGQTFVKVFHGDAVLTKPNITKTYETEPTMP
jgi:hypothetical protein